jgi:hypothetical protein
MKFDVLLLVTDVRAFAKGSIMTANKLSLRATSVAPALPRVFEAVFVLYANVEKLVANGKKIFVTFPVELECILK